MKLIIPVLFIASLLIAACGDDNPTTPQPPNETLIYSLDSHSIWCGNVADDSTIETNILTNIEDHPKYRIEFDGESNIDYNNVQLDVSVIVSDSIAGCGHGFEFGFAGNWNVMAESFKKHHTFTTTDLCTNNLYFFSRVFISNHQSSTLKYIRAKNIKIYKVNS